MKTTGMDERSQVQKLVSPWYKPLGLVLAFLVWQAIVVLLSGALAGQSLVRVVKADGSYLDVTRGVHAKGTEAAAGPLRAWMWPGAFALRNTGSQGVHIVAIYGLYPRGKAPLTPGAELLGHGLWSIIPPDSPSHTLHGGDTFAVRDDWPARPTVAKRRQLQAWLSNKYDLSALIRWPKLRRVLDFYTWRTTSHTFAAPIHDLGWWMHAPNYIARNGGTLVPDNWYGSTGAWWGSGFSNAHYNQHLWVLAKDLQTAGGDVHAFRLGIMLERYRACFGMTPNGYWRDEQGYTRRGNGDNVKFSKQWTEQTFLAYALCPGPLLKEALQRRGASLLATPTWGGSWGARIPARTLEELRCFWEWTGDAKYKADAIRRIPGLMAIPPPGELVWWNKGNQGTAHTSPWMQAQLIAAILRWAVLHGVGTEHVPKLFQMAQHLLAIGTRDRGDGYMETAYRIGKPGVTTSVWNSHPTLTAWTLPLFRALAAVDPDAWSLKLQAAERTVYGGIGSLWSMLDAGQLVDAGSLQIDHPPYGALGAQKVWLAILGGMTK